MQRIATLLGTTCCTRLVILLRRAATCWVLLAPVLKRSNLSQQLLTQRNRVTKRAQHVVPNNVAMCYTEMLKSFGRGLTQHIKTSTDSSAI